MASTNISVSPDVRAALPDVLIDYLCKLVTSSECRRQPIHTLMLVPIELGRGRIQGVLHNDTLRRIFGFAPVSCNLCVLTSANEYQMILAG